MTFHGTSKLSDKIFNNIKESPKVMTTPLIILSIGSIFSGYFYANYFVGSEQHNFWLGSINYFS